MMKYRTVNIPTQLSTDDESLVLSLYGEQISGPSITEEASWSDG